MAHLNVRNSNRYDAFDYRQPMLFNETDYRSAVTRSHQFYHPQEAPTSIAFSSGSQVLQEYPIHAPRATETATQYSFKFPFDYQPRAADLPYRQQRLQFNRRFSEKAASNPPTHPSSGYQTTNQLTYDPKPLPEIDGLPEGAPADQTVERSSVEIPPNKEGHSKYLDPFITTTHLDHTLFDKEAQRGIARKDAITFWDWMKYPRAWGFGLKEPPVIQSFKVKPVYDTKVFNGATYDRELKKTFKFVPHSGLSTESRDKLTVPVMRDFDFNESLVTPPLVTLTGHVTGRTENEMYGGTKRVEEVLKCRSRPISHSNVLDDCRN